ncbi:serine-aspartate repeat-containing protein C-like [Bradysia coprophila]|uniref:serine-aspartate repeat-containing protein C-like n=1 Tax=Bradysia coprophila TaxID=38358 RepID=UPI00187D9DED|nr:serine-aspartate repeat-containing protein C-like [Bradysia coprophila]
MSSKFQDNYESVSEGDQDDDNGCFYDDDDLNDSRSTDGSWDNVSDNDTDNDEPLMDYEESSINFEEATTIHQTRGEIDLDFQSDSDSNDESDFDADDDADYDGDWSWDEALDDPLVNRQR